MRAADVFYQSIEEESDRLLSLSSEEVGPIIDAVGKQVIALVVSICRVENEVRQAEADNKTVILLPGHLKRLDDFLFLMAGLAISCKQLQPVMKSMLRRAGIVGTGDLSTPEGLETAKKGLGLAMAFEKEEQEGVAAGPTSPDDGSSPDDEGKRACKRSYRDSVESSPVAAASKRSARATRTSTPPSL